MKYLLLRVAAPPGDTERLAELLGRVAGGASIERPIEATDHDGGWQYDTAQPNPVVTAYLAIDGREQGRLEEAAALLADGGFAGLEVATVDESDWADAWKRFFRVQHVGRVVIRPTWRRYTPTSGEVVVDLDPGMAFGTGQHWTTRMCLREIQGHVRPGGEVLDVGSGSGILAIAAAKLGAARVVACDTEPLAVKATAENAAANGVDGVLSVSPGSLTDELIAGGFDCVVANVNIAALTLLTPRLAAATRRDGVLVCSGVLAEGAVQLRRLLAAHGMERTAQRRGGDWRAVVFRHAR